MTTTLINDVNASAVGDLIAAVQAQPDKADTLWSATVNWNGGFRSSAQIRDFDPVPSDEPPGLGGTDTAPNPVEQLLGALGNCLAVGYAAGATAGGIEIKDLRIELEGDLDLRTFLGLAPDGHAGYEGIRVNVHLETDATEDQVAALHDAVIGTSPVGHTLARPIPVEIALV